MVQKVLWACACKLPCHWCASEIVGAGDVRRSKSRQLMHKLRSWTNGCIQTTLFAVPLATSTTATPVI